MSLVTSAATEEQRREIAGFQRPFDLKPVVAEFHGMVFYEFGQRGFVAGDIAEFRAMFQRERRRGGSLIEADELELRRFSL